MNCFCDGCNVAARSYEDWIVHLTTSQHQDISSSPKIEKWVTEQNPTCIVLASLFQKMNPVDVANKFSKFGFLWNFYAHEDKKFFIMQYDTRQTADFALAKSSYEASWRLHLKRLKELDTADWAALFPDSEPENEEAEAVSEPPSKIAREDSHFDGLPTKSDDSGFLSNKTRVERQPIVFTRVVEQPKSNSMNNTTDYYDPFELIDSPAANPSKPEAANVAKQGSSSKKKQQSNPNLIPITRTPANPQRASFSAVNITSFEKDLQDKEVKKQLLALTSSINNAERDRKLNGVNPVRPPAVPSAPAPESQKEPKEEKKVATRPSMDQLMSMKKDSSIDEQLDHFFKNTAISLKELEKISNTLIPGLLQILKTKYPAVELCVFDSFQGGIGSPTSSLEVNIDGLDLKRESAAKSRHTRGNEEDNTCEQFVKEIAQLLDEERTRIRETQSSFGGIRMRFLGQASRVNFLHKVSERHDFILTACYGRGQISRKNTIKLITFYARLDPAVRPLLCFVFYWATFHKFVSTEFSKIRDYLLALLVIMFLTKKEVVPSLENIQTYCQQLLNTTGNDWLEKLCNSEKLSQAAISMIQKQFAPAQIFILDLAKEFFEFYGNEKLMTKVICTWTADFLPRTVFTKNLSQLPPQLKQYKKCSEGKSSADLFNSNTALAIQNPFDLTYNMGSSFKPHVLRNFQITCQQTAKLIQELMTCESEGKPCYLMNIFSPIDLPPQEHKPESSSKNSELAIANTRAHCETLVKRIHAHMKTLHIRDGPLMRDECKMYTFFDIDSTFRETFKKRTSTYYTKDETRLRNSHLCCLWSTFSLDFIRTIWSKCFFIDSTERIWYQQQESLGQNQRIFPPVYVTYHSTLECKGYVPLQPGVRMKWKQMHSKTERDKSSQQPTTNVPPRPNPIEEEWTLTQMSLTEAQSQKQTGQPVWSFNCLVAYEDRKSRHENPRIVFIVSGKKADSKSLDYIITSIKKMFCKYQLQLLEEWLNKSMIR